ncbi:MAG: MBL fold metallo-hydrolase [Negativicutes bacterium]|nr:MBL fold metallo-hydrolase [Negativicutes bacterium]
MKIVALEVGNLGTNCYIIYSEAQKRAAVIDPGGSVERILEVLRNEDLTVDMIINTHGHADHVLGNLALKKATAAPILIHGDDADMLESAERNLSAWIGGGASCGPADKILKEGDTITVGEIEMKVIHTGGHTPGGICLLTGNVLFSGDTLFAESIGRTDFPGGSYQQLIRNIQDKLLILDDAVRVLPGHGPETTIGWERKANPFIQ